MRRRLHRFALAAGLAAAPLALPATAAEVTADRLVRAAAEPGNWLMASRTYDGRRYSPLTILDRANVGRLALRFSVPLGGIGGSGNYTVARQASPLVDGGHIYVADGWGRVSKIDGSNESGRIEWTMDPGQDNLEAWFQPSHGLALIGNQVISLASEGRLSWIDANTGELTRTVTVVDPRDGAYLATPPLVADGKVIVGSGGGERGARASLSALDATTGEPRWRLYSIPAPGEAGAESWRDNANAWRNGGGSFEQVGAYDPATNLTVWGTGRAAPRFERALRPGDNLFAASALAIDAATGRLRWYFQFTPADGIGFSAAGSYQLLPLAGGLAVGHFGRNGFHYLIDAANGAFRGAVAYAEGIDWTAGIDPATGRPIEYIAAGREPPAYRLPEPDARRPGCPNLRALGGEPAAYSERTGLSYGMAADGCRMPVGPIGPGYLRHYADGNNVGGLFVGIDPAAGRHVANAWLDAPPHAGALATAGGLVFVPTADGVLHVLDDRDLSEVSRHLFPTLTSAPPVTYAVGGKQYVAVITGGNAWNDRLPAKPPGMFGVRPLFVLAVLGLPD
ncbi:MAG: PQQ-binding-like beta-propeller repeat protein [Bauldia sp.]